MEFLGEFVYCLFLGFGLFILVTAFIRFNDAKRKEATRSLTDSAVAVVRLASLCFLGMWIAQLYADLQSEEEYYSTLTRLTGAYWFGYWIYPLCYGIIPQSLWIKKVKSMKWIRILIAAMLLFAVYIERIVIMIASLHRDYVPSGWTMLLNDSIFYDLAFGSVVFLLVLGLTHFLRMTLRKKQYAG